MTQPRERRAPAADATDVKRPLVGVFLGYPLFDEVRAATRGEPVRSVAAFVHQCFLYGWQVYRRVRSLKALQELREELETLSPGAEMPRIAADRETYTEMQAALNIIMERAPRTVVEQVAEILTERAGRYGDARPKKK